jgi:8-oxo-dGTP diphosphatase
MSKEFTQAEFDTWLATQPKKMIISKLIIRSTEGNILLMKPTYKKTWQFPGGGADAKEDPKAAAIRETKEEVGLNIEISDLKLQDIIYKPKDDSIFIMYSYEKYVSQSQAIVLQKDEAKMIEYVAPDKVGQRLADYYQEFWNKYIGI